jgi:hypothetical protein
LGARLRGCFWGRAAVARVPISVFLAAPDGVIRGGDLCLVHRVPHRHIGHYRAAAQRLLKALGCGALKPADTAIGVVDVTILAGADGFRTGPPPAP